MATETFKNRLSYLALADMDYLSSRVLVLSGLYLRGHAVFADALEKQLKLFLIIFTYIDNKKELTNKEIRSFGHSLIDLFAMVKERAAKDGIKFDIEFDKSLSLFQSQRERLYPENWETHSMTVNLSAQDEIYKYFRNLITANLPIEEQARGREVGGFLFDAYNSIFLKKMIGFTPGTAFKINNDFYKDFDIDFDHIERLV